MSAIVQAAPVADSTLYKRKRSRSRSPTSRARSPPAHRRRRSVSPNAARVEDADPVRRQERERQLAVRLAEEEATGTKKPEFDAQAEFAKLMTSKSGGVYMPPARLRALQAAASKDKSSPDYQRLSWDALRKSLTGIVNRVNIGNIKDVIPELFAENLIRGRGLFARSVMKAQASSLPFTPVFACMVAILNTKLPQVGELLLTRLISQFRRSFKRNDKVVCHATSTFIAHLVNQGVSHEIIALQMLVLLLERPTDDSVEIAVGFMREVGAFLAENSPKANNGVYERFRAVLHEGAIDKRIQYMIEVLFQVRKDRYKDNPILPEGLDLVQEDDQITHQISLDDELQVQEGLNIFKFDPAYIENEAKYKAIKDEILGASDDDDSDSGSEDGSDDDEGEEPAAEKEGIEDMTETGLTNLRRVIYLTIMNSLNYEEAVHKLMKINIQEGQEIELCNMVIECCSQERSYSNFYGLIGERFSKLNRVWCENFEEAFATYYETIHRYETNRLRNIARFFGHLLASDALSWAVFSVVKMNEDDTTSSSRIFIKILMQEMMEEMGLKKLAERFKDPSMVENYRQVFPLDNPKNTRFSINYFTSIGLGIVTEEMREHLKNAPRIIMEQRRAAMEEESSSSDSDSDDSSSDSSDSDSSSDSSGSSRPPQRRRRRSSTLPKYASRRSRSRTPPRRNRSRSVDAGRRRKMSPSRSRSRSRTPPPKRSGAAGSRRDDSPPRRERYRSPPPKERERDGDRKASPSPPPRARGGRDRMSVSRSPSPPRRRRYSDESPPPPRRERRDRSPSPDRYRRDGLGTTITDRLEPVDEDNLNWGCVPQNIRTDIVLWLYEGVAIPSLHTRNMAKLESFANLFNHLHCSTETHYLAVSLFTRYFHRCGYDWARKLGVITSETSTQAFAEIVNDQDAGDPTRMYSNAMYERLVWDIALGCLVIAVKFYHDILLPLHPIYERDFRRMAFISIDDCDLEVAQKEILRSFKYEIHDPTPQAFLSEFPEAFPIMMEVLDELDLARANGWSSIRGDAWEVLCPVTFEPDFIHFPISLLTCAAIFGVLVDRLIEEYAKEKAPPAHRNTVKKGKRKTRQGDSFVSVLASNREHVKHMRTRAQERATEVIDEMLVELKFSTDEFEACCDWIVMVSPH